jgi:hypothetical protein
MALFFKFLTPFNLGAHNFIICNPFLMILGVLDALGRGLQVLFGHHKQHIPPWAGIL